jgi:hypothetical protein
VKALGGSVRGQPNNMHGTASRAHRRPRWQHRQPHPASLK